MNRDNNTMLREIVTKFYFPPFFGGDGYKDMSPKPIKP